jgi:hypothetical protein
MTEQELKAVRELVYLAREVTYCMTPRATQPQMWRAKPRRELVRAGCINRWSLREPPPPMR